MEVYTKSGRLLVGRMAELYLGKCSHEHPCSEEMAAKYRDYFDTLPPLSEQPKVLVNGAIPRQPEVDGLDEPVSTEGASVLGPKPADLQKSKLWRFGGQVYSLLEATSRWVRAGRPRTPPEELKKREEACHACPYWGSARDSCSVCGCGQRLGSLALKRSWSTEACPDDPPRWLNLV